MQGYRYFREFSNLLDKDTKIEFFCKDGDEVKNGQLMGKVTGDIRVASFRRAGCTELSAENERDCKLYTFGGFTSGREQDKTFRYQKDNSEYANF